MPEFQVTIESFDDLSDEEKEVASDNGIGKESASYIRIRHHDKTLLLESDAIEPEDKTFYRDLAWVGQWLIASYQLGRIDGYNHWRRDNHD